MSDPGKEKSRLQRLKEEAQAKNDVQSFIRSYELKQRALGELAGIYTRHAMSAQFERTFKAAAVLLILPSLTNIYYAMRSQSMLAGVMPFAVPVVCLANYFYFLHSEMKEFALTEHPDAEHARQQYDIIYEFSYVNRNSEQYMQKIDNFRRDHQTHTNPHKP